jgi:hypothetical protein
MLSMSTRNTEKKKGDAVMEVEEVKVKERRWGWGEYSCG